MRWNEINTVECSIARALSVVGDRWTMMIVRDVFLGVRRFDDLQRMSTSASNAVNSRVSIDRKGHRSVSLDRRTERLGRPLDGWSRRRAD